MKRIYLVTGAAGHLGNTVVRKLLERGDEVRALVLPGEKNREMLRGAQVCEGDICRPATLEPFFAEATDAEFIVIHCAGIVTIASGYRDNVRMVNVDGTRNILEICFGRSVCKLIYVSSVHAIPELPGGQTMTEVDHFDPDDVVGLYAKTKAEATQLVLDAAKRGLNASVVHPSGICGPYDYGQGHLTQMFKDYYQGRLTAGLRGGYDFCDVRDVANGILACVENGRPGECYILSGDYYTIPEMLMIFHEVSGKRPVRTILPLWFVRATAPLAEAYYKLLRQPPLFTSYSIYTLTGNARFSNKKAQRELGYTARPLRQTVSDMMIWLQETGRI